jgi:hypothetical protein
MRKSTNDADVDKFAEARIEAQNAAQWLARLSHSYGEQSGSDEEIKLLWDRAMQRIVTPEVVPGLVLELFLPTLTLQFAENGQPSPHAIDIDGKSSTEVEAWLLVELLHRGFDREVFSKQLPYRWAHFMSGDEAKYSPQDLVQELRRLTQCFEDSAETLVQVKQTIAIQDGGATSKGSSKKSSETLICWPDGFDIGFSIPTFATGAKDGQIKVGFTLGDDKLVPPGYFVRNAFTASLAAGETTIVLPISQVSAGAMSRANVVDYIAAKIKDVRRLASN